MAKANLAVLSTDELVRAYIDSILRSAATEHVGAHNRLIDDSWRIVDELRARSGGTLEPLRRALDHDDPKVRGWAELALRIKEQPAPKPPRCVDEVYWQVDNAPPIALSLPQIAQHLAGALPAVITDQIVRLARPAIGLWPQRQCHDLPIHASRLGGMPYTPASWSWPTVENEPMLFVGQIDCAALHGVPGSERLPRSGLLSFFGDYNTLMGCGPNGGAVFYFSDTTRLIPAEPPIELTQVFPQAPLSFWPLTDLPDPYCHIVQAFLQEQEQLELYRDVRAAIRYSGIPAEAHDYCGLSKLFGWPSLVQMHDLDVPDTNEPKGHRLLLQVDQYSNGQEVEAWGPGGSLYFMVPQQDLLNGRFDRCELDMQCT